MPKEDKNPTVEWIKNKDKPNPQWIQNLAKEIYDYTVALDGAVNPQLDVIENLISFRFRNLTFDYNEIRVVLTKLLKGAPDSKTLYEGSRRDGGARAFPLICDDTDVIEALKLIGK